MINFSRYPYVHQQTPNPKQQSHTLTLLSNNNFDWFYWCFECFKASNTPNQTTIYRFHSQTLNAHERTDCSIHIRNGVHDRRRSFVLRKTTWWSQDGCCIAVCCHCYMLCCRSFRNPLKLIFIFWSFRPNATWYDAIHVLVLASTAHHKNFNCCIGFASAAEQVICFHSLIVCYHFIVFHTATCVRVSASESRMLCCFYY